MDPTSLPAWKLKLITDKELIDAFVRKAIQARLRIFPAMPDAKTPQRKLKESVLRTTCAVASAGKVNMQELVGLLNGWIEENRDKEAVLRNEMELVPLLETLAKKLEKSTTDRVQGFTQLGSNRGGYSPR